MRALVGLLVALLLRADVAADAPAARIVSTSPSITETLFALDLGSRVVGVSTYCRYPAEARTRPVVGTFITPSPEVIARLHPDLVLLHAGPGSAAQRLASVGVRVASIRTGSLEQIFTSIRHVADLAGVPERGTTLIARVRSSLDAVRGAVAGRRPPRVLMIVGRRTGSLSDLVAVGPGSYLHDLIAIAGGVNVLEDTSLPYPRISMETVIRRAPDVLIDVGEMGESPDEAIRRRALTMRLWQRERLIPAVRHARVYAVHDDAFVVPGPRVQEVTRVMAHWFHGVSVP